MLKEFLIYDGEHPIEEELREMKRTLGHVPFSFYDMGKNTHKLYKFPNGYGASIIQGFMSMGKPELAVLTWETEFIYTKKLPKRKRIRNKLIKLHTHLLGHSLNYDTPVTSDVKRYYDVADLNRDLIRILNFKEGAY